MKLISVDIEADGPCPGDYSMVCFGAVVVEPALNRTYYAELKPMNSNYMPEKLAVSGFTRDQVMAFPDPKRIIVKFHQWLLKIQKEVDKDIVLISDNPAFDWQFINYYLWHFCNDNPFGHSARRIGDIYSGLVKKLNAASNWKKKFRKTKHDHNPLNDALSNAGAIIGICNKYKLKLP